MHSLFNILSWTWGGLITIPGFITYLFCTKVLRCESYEYHGIIYTVLPFDNNSGFSMGLFIFLCDNKTTALPHELGHSIQNALFGPFNLFCVVIPSVIRFWSRRRQTAMGNPPTTGYYDVWFERQATNWGEYAVKNEIL